MRHHHPREVVVQSGPSCAAKIVRYVVVPLAVFAVLASARDVARWMKLVAM